MAMNNIFVLSAGSATTISHFIQTLIVCWVLSLQTSVIFHLDKGPLTFWGQISGNFCCHYITAAIKILNFGDCIQATWWSHDAWPLFSVQIIKCGPDISSWPFQIFNNPVFSLLIHHCMVWILNRNTTDSKVGRKTSLVPTCLRFRISSNPESRNEQLASNPVTTCLKSFPVVGAEHCTLKQADICTVSFHWWILNVCTKTSIIPAPVLYTLFCVWIYINNIQTSNPHIYTLYILSLVIHPLWFPSFILISLHSLP